MTELAEIIQADKQVKSKKRVSDHGEVFTAEREVSAMLDLVKQETERIDSRFLEPACGTGNFLVEVLRRKLTVVNSRYARNQTVWERYAVQAVASLYGVDILQDNVEECRARLSQVVNNVYSQLFKQNCKIECQNSFRFILSRNVLWGDALNLRTPDENADPIVFSEWSFTTGSYLKRRDYTMEKLLTNQPIEGPNLFSDLGDQAFIPTPIRDFPVTHFLKLADSVDNES